MVNLKIISDKSDEIIFRIMATIRMTKVKTFWPDETKKKKKHSEFDKGNLINFINCKIEINATVQFELSVTACVY